MSGGIKASRTESNFDPVFGVDVVQHVDRADFSVPLVIGGTVRAGRQTVVFEATYQTCDARVCLPPQTAKIAVPLTVNR
jgi:thiol:disulfide interchange protein DsbD